MERKHYPIIILAVLICGSLVAILAQGAIAGLIFDQIPYNYTSHVWIPPKDPNGASLGGYYKISGKGRDFTVHLVLSGAEKSESPLDYISDGLRVTGRIDDIQLTYNTISSLLNRDFRGAMFSTKFKGNMNMSCAAWTGTSQFQNNGTSFTGTFNIDGQMTDWEGNYTLVRQDSRIIMTGDYLYYPNNQRSQTKSVQDTFYL